MNIDLIWWITAVELPALACLFWMAWRNHRNTQDDIDDVRHAADVGLAHIRANLDADLRGMAWGDWEYFCLDLDHDPFAAPAVTAFEAIDGCSIGSQTENDTSTTEPNKNG